VGAEARHTFTHFHLRLALRTALVPMERTPERGAFLPLEEFRPSDLPTVMRKAFDLAAKG
jgi:A/G-specific adenine glycosylase